MSQAVISPHDVLMDEADQLIEFLWSHENGVRRVEYEVFLARMQYFKSVVRHVETQLEREPEALEQLKQWFREKSEPLFQKSGLMTRARSWPEGYPGDYLTLEAVYSNQPWTPEGVGNYLDRYFLSSTLAVAVRCRLRRLAELLDRRATQEETPGNWLNLACGSCRELYEDVSVGPGRQTWCVDLDPNSLAYAQELIEPMRPGEKLRFVKQNALRFVNGKRTIKDFGALTTIYSVGLFDYIETDRLVRLLAGLYESLAPGGVLIASFKDRVRYETFDYHWLVKWDYFHQRTEPESFQLLVDAGVAPGNLVPTRDDSGVILFYLAKK